MGKKTIFILSLMLLALLINVNAAIISGTVYDISLNKAKNVIVEINTVPKQQDVAENSIYLFNVQKGQYIIKAKQLENNRIIASAEENITVDSEGKYVIDLILFPSYDEEEEFVDDSELDVISFDEKTKKEFSFLSLILILVLLTAIFIIFYIYLKKIKKKKIKKISSEKTKTKKTSKKTKTKKEEKTETLKTIPVSKDLDTIIKIIKKNDGRATQKEIRKNIPLSEAKISLMIAELENKGLIKKIKKGRGNIIILNK